MAGPETGHCSEPKMEKIMTNPEPSKPRRKIPLNVAALGAIVLLLLVIGALLFDDGRTSQPRPAVSPTPTWSSVFDGKPSYSPIFGDEPSPSPVPDPQGEYYGHCDLLLFTHGLDSEFAASINVDNIGNVGIVVKVTAKFDQLGRDDYTLTKKVRVPVGEVKTVHLSEVIDTDVVNRYQSGGYDCRINGEIVDTFGEVQ